MNDKVFTPFRAPGMFVHATVLCLIHKLDPFEDFRTSRPGPLKDASSDGLPARFRKKNCIRIAQ